MKTKLNGCKHMRRTSST